MHHATDHRRALRRSSFLGTAGIALLLTAGCQPAPKVSAFADTPAQQAAQAKLRQASVDEPLAPFDEKFYVPPPAEDEVASAP